MELPNNSFLQNTFLGSKWFDPDYLFNKGLTFFHNIFNFNVDSNAQVLSIYQTILFLLGIFFVTIISYCMVRMLEIRKKEHKHLHHEIAEYAHREREREKKLREGEGISKNERWVKTLNYVFSQHSSDWKLAIIEADAMLEVLLDQLGFKGETIGDKLKSADQTKFPGLASMWAVHTIRNRIAHEGASFELSQHEAKRVIAIYEQTFREFGFI